MKYCRKLVLCLITCLFFFQSTQGSANLAPITITPEGVLPLSPHESIRMDSQDITIRLKRTEYVVEAVFQFFNTGGTTAQWIGLYRYTPERLWTFIAPFREFRAWVNGKETPFLMQEDNTKNSRSNPCWGLGPLWMVGQVTFPGNASTIVRVRYTALIDHLHGNIGTYYLGNNGYWKDNIKKMVLTFDSTEMCDAEKIKIPFPTVEGPRTLTKKLQRLESTDFKPLPDAKIGFGYVK